MRVIDLKTMQQCEITTDTVVALGTFDGCHLGHMTVFRSAYMIAKKINAKTVAYTFDTIPKSAKDGNIKNILTEEEKIKFIRNANVDYIAIDSFSEIKNLDGETFVNQVLKKKLNAKGASCGYNYRFGKNASCDGQSLVRFFENGGECVEICSQVSANGVAVSSTLIREKIQSGDVEEILQYSAPYSVYASVVEGKKLGRTLNFPTINQYIPKEKISPKKGVYVTECEIGEDVYPSVTNVGNRPTVDSDGFENMETHIIGYNGNLYGSCIRVNFYKRIRDEMKFSSLEELREQIKRDSEKAKDYFK